MPATEAAFGISRHTGSLIDKVSTEKTVEVAELQGSDGEVARAHPYKRMTKGSVDGHGETSVDVGVGDSGVSGLDSGGVTIITSFKQDEENTGWDGWSYSFTHYPFATPS